MSYMDYGAEFRYRIAEIKSRLDHDERRLLVFRQQFQNLVDLCCNIIAIQQGDAVKRLSVLGFTFIPISFVAVRVIFLNIIRTTSIDQVCDSLSSG